MRTVASAILACLAVNCFVSSAATAEIPWHDNLRVAHSQAEAEGKLLLLHFYSDNCVYCERLEAGSFQAPQVSQAISENFVPVKIHANSAPELATMFKVTKFPTDVIVTTAGKKLSHQVSPQDPNQYVAMLVGIAAATKPTAGAIVAAEQAPAATQQPPVATQQPSAASFATDSVTPPAAAAPQSGLTMPAPIDAIEVSAKTQSAAKSQFAGYRDNDQSLVMPDQQGEFDPLGEFDPQGGPDQQVNPVAQGVSENTGDPELAMEGFCAVTVISEDRWVEGKPEHGVIHLGKLYLFQSEEAMNTFLADPVPYTPVLNEIDVVRFFEERVIVPGKREWGVKDPTYQRMFFFADEAAMNHFIEEHLRYTDAAIEVMEKAVKDANPGS